MDSYAALPLNDSSGRAARTDRHDGPAPDARRGDGRGDAQDLRDARGGRDRAHACGGRAARVRGKLPGDLRGERGRDLRARLGYGRVRRRQSEGVPHLRLFGRRIPPADRRRHQLRRAAVHRRRCGALDRDGEGRRAGGVRVAPQEPRRQPALGRGVSQGGRDRRGRGASSRSRATSRRASPPKMRCARARSSTARSSTRRSTALALWDSDGPHRRRQPGVSSACTAIAATRCWSDARARPSSRRSCASSCETMRAQRARRRALPRGDRDGPHENGARIRGRDAARSDRSYRDAPHVLADHPRPDRAPRGRAASARSSRRSCARRRRWRPSGT